MHASIEKYRILHIDTEKHLGGGERQLKFLIENLDKKYESFLALKDSQAIKNFFGNSHCFLKFSSVLDIYSIWRLKKLIKEKNIDILHAHTGAATNYCIILKPFVKGIIVTRRVSFKLHFLRKIKYLCFDKIVVVSPSMIKDFNFAKNKICCIESAIDNKFSTCPQKDESLKKLGLNKNKKYICAIGKIETMKGYEYLLKTFSLLKDIKNLELLIAGSGNISKLENLARKLNIIDRIHFLGFLDDTRYVYMASDICIVSSIYGEGSSAVIKEALSCGKKIIATDVGGAKNLLGNQGILIKPKDEYAIKDAILKLQHRNININFNNEEFSVKKMANQYGLIYQEILT